MCLEYGSQKTIPYLYMKVNKANQSKIVPYHRQNTIKNISKKVAKAF